MQQNNSHWRRWLLYGFVVIAGASVLVRLLLVGSPASSTVQPEKPLLVAAVGDVACNINSEVTASQCQQEKVAQQIKAKNYDRILLLGDLQYDDGTLENYQAVFEPLWKELHAKSISVIGNHEYRTPQAGGYTEYWKGDALNNGETGEFYFSTDLGPWRVVGLNSNCEFVDGCNKDSKQYKWFVEDLQKNSQTCTLAMWHHPRFTSGAYKTNTESTSRSADFWEAAYAGGVDIILNGHDHLYERFARQTSAQEPQKTGVRQFIVGTGGRSLYKAQTETEKNSEKVIDNSFGYLELLLYKKSYSWRFIAIDGTVLDSGSNNCSQNKGV